MRELLDRVEVEPVVVPVPRSRHLFGGLDHLEIDADPSESPSHGQTPRPSTDDQRWGLDHHVSERTANPPSRAPPTTDFTCRPELAAVVCVKALAVAVHSPPMRRLLFPIALVGAGAGAARKAASMLATRPDRHPRQVLEREPVGETVWIDRPDGTRLRAIVAGEGRTVVLAHGYGVSLIEWNVVAERLLELGYRVVCFDQRGHELSTVGSDGIGTMQMAGDYLAVLEQFDLYDAILVGHSMGGFLAIAAVLDVPGVAERLSGLVLFAAFAGAVLDGAPQNRVQIPLIEHGILQRLISSETVGMLFGASVSGSEPSPSEIRVFLDTFRRQDHHRLVPILRAFTEEDRYARLGSIDIPTMVVAGRRDRTTPPLHSERLAAGIPGAGAIWSDRGGHILNWEAPELLVMAIREL